MQYEEKVWKLRKQIKEYADKNLIVAFSGGVDSSLLLKLSVEAAEKSGRRVYAIFLHTMLHPAKEAEEARVLAEEMGASFLVLEVDELEGAGILENPPDRCYRCKKFLFEQICSKSKELGNGVILEGTNEDDLYVYRPGIRAVKELGIASPLADAGLTKKEVRRLAAELGVRVSDKPSAPCLATRFPYGTSLSYREMHRVEEGESYLRRMGFYNVRLRIHGDIARIEIDMDEMEQMLRLREHVVAEMKKLGFFYVTLDLEGFRSGSMDVHLSGT